ncbi:MAG: hypothetical protein AAF078_06175, partial [Planctomycetota bacterium]
MSVAAEHQESARLVCDDGLVLADIRCYACGHGLRGRAETGTCAKCGASVADSLDRYAPTFALDADGRLSETLSCLECGYDLRGLLPTDSCPECGTSVVSSMRSDLLMHANLAWVGWVRTGLALFYTGIVVGLVGGFVLGVMGAVAGMAAAMSAGNTGTPSLVGMGVAMVVLQVLVCGTLQLFAVFWFTSSEPGGAVGPGDRVVRAARWGASVGYGFDVVIGGIGVASMTAVGFFALQQGAWKLANAALTSLSMAAATVALVGLMWHGARLFARVPSGR